MSYVSNIADLIVRHSSDGIILGPEHYTAIAEWEKREIPEDVVFLAVKEVYSVESDEHDRPIPAEVLQMAVIRNFRKWLVQDCGSRAANA